MRLVKVISIQQKQLPPSVCMSPNTGKTVVSKHSSEGDKSQNFTRLFTKCQETFSAQADVFYLHTCYYTSYTKQSVNLEKAKLAGLTQS